MGATTARVTAMVIATAMTTTGKDNNDSGKDNDDSKDNDGGGGRIPARLTTIY
jgi:hypothetical protein